MPWRLLILPLVLASLLVGCGGDRGKGVPFYRRGRQLVLKKDYEAGRQAFEECLRRQPDYALAHLELGMLCEEPFQDLWQAVVHYREFVRLAPEHGQRPVVERWVGRLERRLLTELAERHPDTVASADVARLRDERDDLARRLRGAATLYGDLKEENAALKAQLEASEESRLLALQDGVKSAARATGTTRLPKPPKAAPASPTPRTPDQAVRMHTIVGGDTLAGISRQYYGSIRYWPKLQVYNRDLLRGGTMLIRGKSIRIPPLTELKKTPTLGPVGGKK